VISVGNITAGGTGKTPLVAEICRLLAAEGRRVCVLTRGYGRENTGDRVLVSDGTAVLAQAAQSGDEPLLLAEKLLGVAAVVCDADRAAAGRWAIETLDSNVFVLDDGFQHLQLARDLDVVVIDATNPWGGGHLLPRGTLRELPHGLARADCAIITRTEQTNDTSLLEREIHKLIDGRPVLTSQMQTKGVREMNATALASSASVPQPVFAFCAIGNPASFLNRLRHDGMQLAKSQIFPDHYSYKQADISELSRQARDAGAASLITTEKDAVKLRHLRFGLPCYALEIAIAIDNEGTLRELVRNAISTG
jgi:tetraacyldisaccharide 4'-kinase